MLSCSVGTTNGLYLPYSLTAPGSQGTIYIYIVFPIIYKSIFSFFRLIWWEFVTKDIWSSEHCTSPAIWSNSSYISTILFSKRIIDNYV
jgi:hypothetical protein